MTTTPPTPRTSEAGAALLTVIMMLALVSALTLSLAVVTTNNLATARMSQQAGAALNSSDAGVAQAVTYLRENGVGSITNCSPTCTNPWGNKTTPARITIPGKAGQTFEVWIEPLVNYPANEVGTYRIHSRGLSGGNAGRSVEVDAEITAIDLPIGIVAESVSGGGNAGVHHMSVFSTGCVYQRSKITFEGVDVVYDIPAAVHTSQVITDSNGTGKYCPSTANPIHKTTGSPSTRYCNAAYPDDQDKNGGPLAGTTCYRTYNGVYPETSLIASAADMFARYNVREEPFTQAQLDQLKTVAISQGNYYTTTNGWTAPTTDHAVLYFDLAATDPGGLVDLNQLIPQWSRPPELSAADPACQPRSLLVLISGGNARLNSNSQLAASTFLLSKDPYGNVSKANGASSYTGTLYANNLDLTGTSDMYMDSCFIANPSPALTTVRTYNYREVDR